MKKYYIILLFITSWVNAQIVTIPDANFKTKLLSASSSNFVAYSNGVAVDIDLNNDNEIQTSEAVLIDSLNVSGFNIASLIGINDFLNLKKLVCTNNQLTSLDVSALASLKRLNANFNQLTAIDLSSNVLLEEVRLSVNLLNTIDVSELIALNYLELHSNQLTAIDVSALTNLEVLGLSNNLLTTLDCSQNLNLKGLYVAVNLLSTVFIKNGIDESQLIDSGSWMENWFLNNNPNLQYICADDNQIAEIQAITGPGVNVNSYCSFTPGGDFNTISGTTKFDLNNDGCDVADANVPFLSFGVALNTEEVNAQVYSNSLGNYSFLTGEVGTFSLTPILENPNYFSVTPNPASIIVDQIDNSTTIQDFCVSANGIHPDVEVVIVPILPAMPGFDAIYKLVYKNKGNQTVNGSVFFEFDDTKIDFVSATEIPDTVLSGSYGFNYSDLQPFETQSILLTFNINSPTETPAVNIGDVLEFNANIIINSATEIEVTDNVFAFNQTIVGSYDPNDITCLEGNTLPTADIGTYLHYNIRFENTGTAAAENIVVKSEIDLTQYNLQSLQIMESSHPVTIRVTDNIAEFIFQNIDLDTGGHGNILLKLKSNAALSNNEVVNSADIFFDYNFPIETNDEQTVFADLSKNDFTKDLSIQVYPNPVQNVVTIKADHAINRIQLYDAQGRLLIMKIANENTQTVDISGYASGVYFLNVSTTLGKQTQKIIKK